ncbi:hypothetical protein ASC90_16595 [Rhizobium sp. Root1220]|nr:hypothetical protein ASC90_16595 [Rhizobium sp. Root1220]
MQRRRHRASKDAILPVAFPLTDDAEAVVVRFAGIREGADLRTALAANGPVLAGADAAWSIRFRARWLGTRRARRYRRFGTAFTATDDVETIAACLARIAERLYATAALAADGSILHRAHLGLRRARVGRWSGIAGIDIDSAGRKERHEKQREFA